MKYTRESPIINVLFYKISRYAYVVSQCAKVYIRISVSSFIYQILNITMVSNRGIVKSRICLICSHEIILYNNDQDFSWDMHKQEVYHKNSRLKGNKKMTNKADTHMCIQHMKTFFGSKSNIDNKVTELINLSIKELNNTNRNEIVLKAVAKTVSKVYPGNFTVRPFGSRISGLTTREVGDLDLFIDTSSESPHRTLVESPEMENYYLRRIAEYMENTEKDTWVNVVKVLTCRTPILKVLHYDTKLQCDITVMNGLGNINTELTSMFIKNIYKFKPMVLMIREWSAECEFIKEINNYALSLLVLFYLQHEKYAPSVYVFEFDYNKPRTKISGYDCLDYNQVNFDWNSVKSTENVDLKTLLHGFFSFYSGFDFANNVICPLLGKSISNNLFTAQGKKLPAEMITYVMKLKNRGEQFKLSKNGMNIQDPIDLAHNLTKSSHEAFVNEFICMCDSAKRALEIID